MTGVTHREVGPDEAEQRLDRWFRRHWPHVSQGRIEKMCRKGEIRVDGARAKAATRIAPGQTIRVPPLPDPSDQPQHSPGPAEVPVPDEVIGSIVFRDDHMIVLNKPPGLAVQGGSKQSRHLGAMLPGLRFGRADDPRLVHRLDRDTSGLLVLARTGAAATALGRLFKSKAVDKIYVAAVAGRVDPPEGTIRTGLVKAGGRGTEKMETLHPNHVADTPGAKLAITDYAVIDQLGSRLAAVALRPVTGRTHQLRAHMATLGCPIAGDGKYGGRSQENLGDGWGAGLGGGLSRKMHLHAVQLHMPHPVTGKMMHLHAPLPDHMARTWDAVGWSAKDLTGELLERPV